jgi:hypothetical protein
MRRRMKLTAANFSTFNFLLRNGKESDKTSGMRTDISSIGKSSCCVTLNPPDFTQPLQHGLLKT